MDKQKKQLIIVGVLILVFIFSLLNSLKKKPATKGGVQVEPAAGGGVPQPAATQQAVSAPTKPSEKKLNEQFERAKLAWGRDPFAAPSEKEYQIGELQLKGISFDKKNGGYAFINSDIVKKGDIVGDYEVVEIEKDRVLLKKGNQSFYLVFPGQE